MGKKLLIVESPAKARTINRFLGDDYAVKASMGHVLDLPPKKFGVDVEHGFKPEYEMIRGRGKVVEELKKAAAGAETIYLAPDPDREGEAIAWHLKILLGDLVPEERFRRITYHEITKQAIRQALHAPAYLDMERVYSQQARRVLDRIVGYRVSPLLWHRIPGATSAGRVQSVALRLVCEREAEIENFVSEEYWVLGLKARKQAEPLDPFTLRLAQINGEKARISNAEEAAKVRSELDGCSLRVERIKEKSVRKRPRPPYITSTLQQAGSSVFGFSPTRTMRIAQRLYEGVDLGEGTTGLITYMRTDSPNVSTRAVESCRAFIGEQYGNDYLPSKANVFKGKKSAQEAHEAVRPTDVRRTPESLRNTLAPEEFKLYALIWERFVASQMAPATIVQRLVVVQAAPGARDSLEAKATTDVNSYLLRASASEVVFPGYMKVARNELKAINKTDKEEDSQSETGHLPPLIEGEALDCLELLQEQKFTQPPPRFSEATLVRVLEENGVGRPSTYAQILATLDQRGYVEKEKRSLKPTDLGRRVNDFLVSNLDSLFNVRFTAEMEQKLDEIEEGKQDWVSMLGAFYKLFTQWVAQARGPRGDESEARRLVELLGEVKDWAPPVQRGKRTFDDKKFLASIEKQLQKEEPKLSERQVDTLKNMVVKYIDQLPAARERAEELGLTSSMEKAAQREPPRDETLRKLGLLEQIKFDEPRKAGKRVYDDSAFVESLRHQAQEGRRLTENQIRYLDRILIKYREQIAGFEQESAELGLNAATEGGADKESGPLLDRLKQVRHWKEPVKRGRRTWDDKAFFESLSRQYRERGRLSVKQQQSLKRMAAKYAEQIPEGEASAKEASGREVEQKE